MNYNSLMNKPTINYRELIGDNTVSEVGGITEEQFTALLNTDLSSYYTKAQIDELFARSFVYREKSGSIVTFDCPESTTSGITSLSVGIKAVQAGNGDPSPTNVRPISGVSAVNVYDGPTTDPQDATVYTIDLDGTRYGGTLDVVSGELTVDRVEVDLGTVDWNKHISSVKTYFRTITPLSDAKKSDNQLATHNLKCSNYKEDSWTHVVDSSGYDGNICIGWLNNAYIAIYDSRYVDASATDFKTAMSGVQLVYELATPQTIQLTPTMVKSLLGTNNLWADSGDIEVKCLDRIIPAGE